MESISGALELETSPCTGVCVIDSATGLCAGCYRSMDEIAAWQSMPRTERTAVLQRLRERQQKLRERQQKLFDFDV